MIRSILGLALWLACTVAAPADWKDKHVEGTREHHLLKFYPEARVDEYSAKDFDAAEIVTGYKKGAEEPAVTETVEGAVTRFRYEHKPRTSPLEIVRQYEGALKRQGFATLVAGRDQQFPGLPALGGSAAFGSFRLDRDGVPAVWVNVSAWEQNGPNDPMSDVVIVEIKGMEQKLEANAATMLQEIEQSGRVAVYGITFETGKATIRPESDKVLAEVLKLLNTNGSLKLRIEGHTDNVGAAAANRKLSEERANAVKAWLVQKGVKPATLAASGSGDSKPVAENGSEAGRAKNRRVELVKQ
jgi:outer membrane protein OmpA-like peptidoglycan-associated protein